MGQIYLTVRRAEQVLKVKEKKGVTKVCKIRGYNTFGISMTFSGTKVLLSAILKTSMPTLIFIYPVLNIGLV